jgi:hypothetical protein
MRSKLTRVPTAGTLLICIGISIAFAGSVTQPREDCGHRGWRAPFAGPLFRKYGGLGLPERNSDQLGITIPIVTGRQLGCFSGQGCSFFRCPLIETGVQNTSYNASVYNPALRGQLAWDLGSGFGFSYAFGAYSDVDESVAVEFDLAQSALRV